MTMKKISLLAFALISLLLAGSSCDKKEKNQNNFCTVQSSAFPESDTAIIILPNAFSPNGDGKNDVWLPIVNGSSLASLEFTVFDVSGNVHYQSTGLNDRWEAPGLNLYGIQKFKVKVKAVSLAGNTMEQCLDIYAYFCNPDNYPIANYQLLFPDQIDITRPDDPLATLEDFQPCN